MREGQVPFTSTAGGLLHTGGRQDHCKKDKWGGCWGREERGGVPLGLGVSLGGPLGQHRAVEWACGVSFPSVPRRPYL